jgi:hypothetical protein
MQETRPLLLGQGTLFLRFRAIGLLALSMLATSYGCSSGDSSSPGSAATPDGGSAAGNCNTWTAKMASCDDAGTPGSTVTCDRETQHASDVGCTNAWLAYLQCSASAPIDCATTEIPSCNATLAGYRQCVSNAVVQNPCERASSADFLCSAVPATPKAWGCLAPTTRTDCAPAPVDSGSSALYYCCP